MLNGLYICAGCFLVFTGVICCNAQYQAVKKYYPSLTIWEYLILQDKLRITPERD